MSRRLPAVLAVLVAGVLTGCSTVPSSSPTVQITQVAEPSGEVGIEAPAPERGATPEEVVRGFIDANASTTRSHPVARQYLTRDAARTWSDSDGVTVVESGYAAVPASGGTVQVTGDLAGTVDSHGVFTVGGGSAYARTFTVTKEQGEWRIADPPDGLVLAEPDFARTYDQLDVYFLDPTGSRVVPDPRYLVSGGAQLSSLVERLLDGPSPALNAAVVNGLSGAELRSTVTVDARTATVDLTGLADPSEATAAALAAQLVWTLAQLDVGGVRVLLDGQPMPHVPSLVSPGDFASLDPDPAPIDAVGHYLWGGALYRADGTAAPGPAGTGSYGLTSAAVTTDPRTGALSVTTAVSAANGQATLWTGTYGDVLNPVLTGGSFTPPSTAITRAEAWTVRDGAEVVRVPAGGPAQTVTAPTLAGLGRVTQLQLSPDGVRVAVVIESGGSGGQLFVGSVVRDDESVSVRDLRAVTPTLRHTVDVAWRNAGTLLLLAGDPSDQRTVPYSVDVDGWDLSGVTTAGLPPGDPTSLAAAPTREPLVSAGGTMWQLQGGTWTTLVRGAEPLPGTDPFYPL
ncbi:LpqB family beta-propeller domain-containing protein [Modestobacter sp. NPDC049651]|uniref:LpqB family beta-propeller domain-containing protein n=1 Tax=unclassified Modestobacter TaxID=2643866 RepID=UPI0033FA1835